MKILNFGSFNIDHVYTVEAFVRPGETIHSLNYSKFAGGKGFNQSVALAYTGAEVYHAGKIGNDGIWMRELLEKVHVDTSYVNVIDTPTGHGVIQVNQHGENCIVLYGGANQKIETKDVHQVLENFSAGDYLLLQNEISCLPEIMTRAADRGMIVAFNPAPMNGKVASYPLEHVRLFILNEIEAMELTGEKEPEKMLHRMLSIYPHGATILTLGSKGAMYGNSQIHLHVAAESVTPIDTTGAGDTFIGYYLGEYMIHGDVERALMLACTAAAICVTKKGAFDSIPTRTEVDHWMW